VWVSVSVTTRRPRPGEVDGVHYRFVTDAEFDRLIQADELLEWATFAGHRYGTPRQPVLDHLAAGIPVLLEIEISGARQVRARWPTARLVFLAPPSWEELEARLARRGTEPAEVRSARLALAQAEMAARDEFDVVIVNTNVEDVCQRLLPWLGIPADDRKARNTP
jgi:guanylate kinase